MSNNIFNIARRASIRNEHDLVQENMLEDDFDTTPQSTPDIKKKCLAAMDQVTPDSPLFKECYALEEVKNEIQRRNSDRLMQSIAFQGMHPGEAAAAMAARSNGSLSHAQIQRRMTNSKPRLW